MRIYKVLDLETYNKLMEIYRNKYHKLQDSETQTGGGTEVFEEKEPETSQTYWTSFEQTVAEIRSRQKDKKKRRRI